MYHLLQASAKAFDLHMLLLGEEEWNFIPEVLFRSAVMFFVALISMRLIGKRGIMQDVFELITIITLGSAAGDPMFYKKVGLLPAILVFATIILMYKIVNYVTAKSKALEHMVEGVHRQLIRDGRFTVEKIAESEMKKDNFLADLRIESVSQLGQVKTAYVESSGELSVFFYPDEEVKWGLPILPDLHAQQTVAITEPGTYACAFCGYVQPLAPAPQHACPVCSKDRWVKASNEKRIK